MLANTYYDAGKGLKKMFFAQIGAVACTILAMIPVVNIIGGIGAVLFAILSVVGLYGAGKDIEGCKTAFVITVIQIAVSVVSSLFSASRMLYMVFGSADAILSLLVIYYVCNSVADVMTAVGAGDVAAKGRTVWKINLGCCIAIVVISVCALIPVVNVIAGIAGMLVTILSVVAAILYMVFLYRSYQALGA